MNLVIAIPCFNCESEIYNVVKAMRAFESVSHVLKIVILDNHSLDQTRMQALAAAGNSKKILVKTNSKNIGLGGSFKKAWFLSQKEEADFLVFFHGDGQASIKDLEKIVSTISDSHDFYFGSRFMKKSSRHDYSKFRHWGNLLFNEMFSLLVQNKITDIGSGLNIYRIGSLSDKFIRRLPNHIAFDVPLHLEIFRKKSFCFHPITWNDDGGRSTTTNLGVSAKIIGEVVRYYAHEYLQ